MNNPLWSDTFTSIQQLGQRLSEFNSYLKRWVTEDERCLAIKTTIGMLATQPDSVLIIGDSGTGKELLARSLHWKIHEPFLALNCAALSDTLYLGQLFGHKQGAFTGANCDKPGIFEAANEGTVFLDEIGDMPLHQQAALLRIIQEREVAPLGSHEPIPIRCRVIAATNKDIFESNTFREDLLGRLSTFVIRIPPLTERVNDIYLIAKSYGINDEDAAALHVTLSAEIKRFGVRAIQAAARRQAVTGIIK